MPLGKPQASPDNICARRHPLFITSAKQDRQWGRAVRVRMLEGQAGPQHHGRGRDRETREAICGGLEKVSARDRVTSGHLARASHGVRTPDTADGPERLFGFRSKAH